MKMPTDRLSFTMLDWGVVVLYFVGITVFGLWMSRRVRSSGGYFLGDRKLPWWIMVAQSFSTGTHAENPVAQTGVTFRYGFATIWYQWKNVLITPFYWLMAPWYRRSERTTVAEMIEDRYGRALALIYMVYAIAFFIFCQGALLKGAGKVIAVATGGQIISPNGVVVAMTVAFVIYSFFGGLVAVAYTNFIQGLLIIALSFMLIPLGLSAVGGFAGMRADLPADFFTIYSSASGLDAFTILMLTINGLVGITAQPHMLSMNATGKSERAGRVGLTYGSMVKRFCTIGWALTGLIVASLVIRRGDVLADKEAAFGYACLHLLTPGLTGLMVACVMAATMSACSNFMVSNGANFTQNLYAPFLRPTAGDRELLWCGRVSGLAFTMLAIGFAIIIDQILQAFLFTETIAAFMGVMFLGGLLWKRANRYGAAAATLLTFVVYYALNYLATCGQGARAELGTDLATAWSGLLAAAKAGHTSEFLATGTLQLVYNWTALPFAWTMLVGLAALVLVSLITPPEPKERLNAFFDNMNRSTDHEALPDGASKPLAAEEGKDLILLDLPGWLTAARWRGFFHRYWEDLIGFVLGTLTVALLVLMAWGLMQIGK